MSTWLELYVKIGLYCHTFAIVGKVLEYLYRFWWCYVLTVRRPNKTCGLILTKHSKINNNRQRVIQYVLGHTDVMIVRMCHKNSHHRGNGCQGEKEGWSQRWLCRTSLCQIHTDCVVSSVAPEGCEFIVQIITNWEPIKQSRKRFSLFYL